MLHVPNYYITQVRIRNKAGLWRAYTTVRAIEIYLKLPGSFEAYRITAHRRDKLSFVITGH